MLCTNCGSANAAYHYKTITNGVLREEHLCRNCAAQLKGAQNGGFTDLLSGFFRQAEPRSAVCPTCGTTQGEVSRTGQVGCPDCYAAFAQLLEPYIRRIQGSDAHKGVLVAQGTVDRAVQIKLLKKQLEQAVEAQEYERAAQLRDSIKELEGGGKA